MSRNLTLNELHQVRAMLRCGRRHAAIARALDLSLWTIARVASEPRLQRDDLTDAELPEDDGPADFESGALRRCIGCGAMVYRWPCLACQMASAPRILVAIEDVDGEEEDDLLELLAEVARS